MIAPRRTKLASPRRAGVTLLEVVTSATAAAILFAGMASAVAFSLRAADPTNGRYTNASEAGKATLLISRDLQCATAFNDAVCTATCVEFTMPDQNGDGFSETVRYSWSGVSGASLLRTFNGGTAQTVATNVTSFVLRYRTKSVAPTVYNESAEQQFLDQSSSNSGFLSSYQDVGSGFWFGEYFKPTLPSTAVSWRITRIQLYLDNYGSADGTPVIQVRSCDDSGNPAKNLGGQVLLSEVDLANNWYTISFTNATGLPTSQGACAIIGFDAGSDSACRAKEGILSTSTSGTYAIASYDGVTWTTYAWTDMWLRVWGTYTTTSSGTPLAYYRTGVDMTLQLGSDATTAVTTAIQTVNQPQVTGP